MVLPHRLVGYVIKYIKRDGKVNYKNLKIAIFWDITPCNPYMNQRFRGTYHICLQDRKSAKKEISMPEDGQEEFGHHFHLDPPY
jgi:hypothetical protein